MGDPAELSPADRAQIRELAAKVVESVVNDERMPLGFKRHSFNPDVDQPLWFYMIDDVGSLVLRMAQEICALSDAADRAAERLLFCMRIYRGYKIGESRGPNGCLFDAIAAVRPDVAAELSDGIDESNVYDKHFQTKGPSDD